MVKKVFGVICVIEVFFGIYQISLSESTQQIIGRVMVTLVFAALAFLLLKPNKKISAINTGLPSSNTGKVPTPSPLTNAPMITDNEQNTVGNVNTRKSSVTPFAIAAVVLLLVVVIFTRLPRTNSNSSSPSVSRSELAKVMDLSEEQETAMLSLFKNCGIGELSSAKQFHVGEERTSYHIDDEETSAYSGVNNTIVVWVDNETKTVQEIYFSDETIYADGEVQGQVTDYYISEEARSNYRVVAQMYVNQCLNYPDTAKYPSRSGWAFGVRDGLDVVQSTVTAQNAFGVSDTMQFSISFNRSNSAVVSLILDGKEYIG